MILATCDFRLRIAGRSVDRTTGDDSLFADISRVLALASSVKQNALGVLCFSAPSCVARMAFGKHAWIVVCNWRGVLCHNLLTLRQPLP
jgi:hypothetical protein